MESLIKQYEDILKRVQESTSTNEYNQGYMQGYQEGIELAIGDLESLWVDVKKEKDSND